MGNGQHEERAYRKLGFLQCRRQRACTKRCSCPARCFLPSQLLRKVRLMLLPGGCTRVCCNPNHTEPQTLDTNIRLPVLHTDIHSGGKGVGAHHCQWVTYPRCSVARLKGTICAGADARRLLGRRTGAARLGSGSAFNCMGAGGSTGAAACVGVCGTAWSATAKERCTRDTGRAWYTGRGRQSLRTGLVRRAVARSGL